MARLSSSTLTLPLFGALALASLAAARHCQNLTVELDLSSRNGVFDLEIPSSDMAVTDFIFEMGTQGRNYSDELLTGVRRRLLHRIDTYTLSI